MTRTRDGLETVGKEARKPGPMTRAEQGTRERVVRKVRIKGLTPIMFARYPGDNDTKLEPWQRLYFVRGTKELSLPPGALDSFLSAQNTDSAPKRLLDSRKYKRFGLACSSYVLTEPHQIPLLRDGKPILFDRLGKDETDPSSGIYLDHDTARLEKGIPNPQVRPVLPLPWECEFSLTLFPNQELQEQQLLNIFTAGGIAVGLGTHRPRFGKFEVVLWE